MFHLKLKDTLKHSIATVTSHMDSFVYNPGRDYSRIRKLSPDHVISLLLLPKSLNFQSRNSSINTLLLMVLLLLFSAFQSIRLMIILSQKDILPPAFTAYTLMPFMT